MKIVALVNRAAGSVGPAGEERRGEIVRLFAENGIAADVRFFEGAELKRQAQQAVAEAKGGSLDAIVVGGGDGSVACVAAELVDTGIALGILPLGTLNHFAKDLHLPLKLEDAIAAIAGGNRRAVDMGEVNGRLFINNSSVGVYPYMVIDRDSRRRRTGLPKALAGIIAFARMLRRFPHRRLAISAEGWREPVKTPCLFVGNNVYTTGLFELGKRERLDGGKLFVALVRPTGPLGFIALAFGLAFGTVDAKRRLRTAQVGTARISAWTSRLPVALDGEVETLATPLVYSIRPGALTVFAPRPASATDRAPPTAVPQTV